jgi:hypothetical protein
MIKGTIERAYELAPTCGNIEDIRTALRQEGYTNVDAHLAGRVIRCDLTKLLNRQA